MAYITGTATGHINLLDHLRRFLCGFGIVDDLQFTGTGTGDLIPAPGLDPFVITKAAAPTETWTITCTTAGAGAVFSVTGSVSGAQDPATAGTEYENDFLQFLIEDSGDFVLSDEFTIDVVEADLAAVDQHWTQLRWRERPDEAGQWEWLGMGRGMAGTDEIYIGLRTFQSVPGDYYNWEIRGYTGYVEENTWANQPGPSPSVSVLLFQSPMPYRFIANGRRFFGSCQVSTVFASFHAGFFLPYATPQQYPYPIIIGGTFAGAAAQRWSNESATHRFPFRGPFIESGGSSLRQLARGIDGTWVQWDVFPWSGRTGNYTAGHTQQVYRPMNSDQDYTVFPLQLHTPMGSLTTGPTGLENIFGQIDGVYGITGFGTSVNDIVTIEGEDYLVMQDIYRTGFNDYVAFKLE